MSLSPSSHHPTTGSRRFRSDAASFSPSSASSYPYYPQYPPQPQAVPRQQIPMEPFPHYYYPQHPLHSIPLPHQPLAALYHMPVQYPVMNQHGMYMAYAPYQDMMAYQTPFMIPPTIYPTPAGVESQPNGPHPAPHSFNRAKPKRQYQSKSPRSYSPLPQHAYHPSADHTKPLAARSENETERTESKPAPAGKAALEPATAAKKATFSEADPDANKKVKPAKTPKSRPVSPVSSTASTDNDQSRHELKTEASPTPNVHALPILFPASTLLHFNASNAALAADRTKARARKNQVLAHRASEPPISFHAPVLRTIDYNPRDEHEPHAKPAAKLMPSHETELKPESVSNSQAEPMAPAPEQSGPVPEQQAPVSEQPAATAQAPASVSEPPQVAKETKPTTNWAAILHTSNPPAKASSAKSKLTAADSLASTHFAAAPAPAHEIASALSDSAQPLGTLLLRILYDPAYLILSPSLPQFKTQVRGLTNTGNICYMNAVLQILLFCEPFNRLLHLIKTKATGTLDKQSHTPLLDATIKFFSQFSDDNTPSVYSPDKYYQTLINHEKFQHIKWGQQEDAEEFLGYFLDGLNEEFLGAMRRLAPSAVERLVLQFQHTHSSAEASSQFQKNVEYAMQAISRDNTTGLSETTDANKAGNNGDWNEVGGAKKVSVKRTVEVEPTPITMLFGGQFRLELTIPKSSSTSFVKSVTLDPFQHVQLDISGCKTLEDAFLRVNVTESISYKGKNDHDMVVKKQTFMDVMPPVLVVHLKRFSYLREQDLGVEKLLHQVLYTHQLNVPQQVLSGQAQVMLHTYTLMGVVYHIGANAEGGHYTSDVRATDGKWNRIDDTNIAQVSAQDVLEAQEPKTAYILFYVRQ